MSTCPNTQSVTSIVDSEWVNVGRVLELLYATKNRWIQVLPISNTSLTGGYLKFYHLQNIKVLGWLNIKGWCWMWGHDNVILPVKHTAQHMSTPIPGLTFNLWCDGTNTLTWVCKTSQFPQIFLVRTLWLLLFDQTFLLW